MTESDITDILQYLKNNGYFAFADGPSVTVKDPVYRCASNGMLVLCDYKTVVLPDWAAARRFVLARG